MEREHFIFYKSFYEATKYLSDEDKWKLLDIICKYWFYWEEPDIDGYMMWMFSLIKPQLDANNKKYIDWCKWWDFWALWWAPKWNKNACKTYEKQLKQPHNNPKTTPKSKKTTPNDNDNDNVNDNENEYMSPWDILSMSDIIKEKKEKVAPKERKEKNYCEEFEYLWKIYPHWKWRGSKPNSYRKRLSWTEEEKQKILDKAKEKKVCCECWIDNKQYSKAFEWYMENERWVDFDLESFVYQLMENKKDKDNIWIKLAKEYWWEDIVQKFVKKYVLTHDTMTLDLH